MPDLYQIFYSGFDWLNGLARFTGIADTLCGFILVGYLFTPRIRLLFTKDSPNLLIRAILGALAFCGLVAGVLIWIGVATTGKAVTIQKGHALLTPRGEQIFQTLSQKGHAEAERLIGTRMPDWGYLIGAKEFDGINIALYAKLNPFEYFVIFETPKQKELTLEQMFQILDQYAQRAKSKDNPTPRLLWRRQGQDVSAKITVIGQMPLVLKNGSLSAEQIQLKTKRSTFLAMKTILIKGDKRFTVVGGIFSGMIAEAQFVNFIEQMESPAPTAGSANANVVWGKAQMTKPELLSHADIIAVVNVLRIQQDQNFPGSPKGSCWKGGDMDVEKMIRGKGVVAHQDEIVCNENQISTGRFLVFRKADTPTKIHQINGGPIVVDEYEKVMNYNSAKLATFLPIWQDQVPWYSDNKSTELVWTTLVDVLKQIRR